MTDLSIIDTEEAARDYVGRCADQAAIERLERFTALLLEENQRQNLISRSSEVQIWQRHMADSAQLLEHVSRETLESVDINPWLDLGTGAGFPGIVLAALRPETPFRLVESRSRRVEFLSAVVEALDLPHCQVLGDKLERIEPFATSVITARAFAPLEKLLRLSAPFSTKQTCYILPKGRSASQELERLKPSIRKLFHVEQSLTDGEAGIIVGRAGR